MDNHNLPLNFPLNNKYRIKKVLGQGGFGITYLAEDTLLDIDVCVKELFISGSSTRGSNMTVMTHNMKDFSFADFKDRFLQEAKQLARFGHPNIVRVMDFFEANNTAYVVMEYIEGQTLKDKVAFGRYQLMFLKKSLSRFSMRWKWYTRPECCTAISSQII